MELKVPPDLVWLVVAGLMWLASLVTPRFDLPWGPRIGGAAVLTLVGVWAVVSARASLISQRTTG